jgi:hypothetical protein
VFGPGGGGGADLSTPVGEKGLPEGSEYGRVSKYLKLLFVHGINCVTPRLYSSYCLVCDTVALLGC